MDMNEIEAIFFQECEEGLVGLEACFAELSGGVHDPETINTIFRHVHSIKGGAGAFGLERLQPYAHQYESLLDLVRSGAIALDDDLLSLLLGAFDLLSDHVTSARDHVEAPDDAAMLERLTARCEAPSEPAQAPSAAEEVSDAPTDEGQSGDGFDDLMAMLDLPDFGAGSADENAEGDEPDVADADDWQLEYNPGSGAFANGGEPLLVLRELHALAAGSIVQRCWSEPSSAVSFMEIPS